MNAISAYSPAAPYGAATRRGARMSAIAVVIGLHALVIAALLMMTPVREALMTAPIVVRLISPPQPEPPKVQPKPVPPKPRVEPKKVQPPPPPVMTAPPAAPTQIVAPSPPPPAPLPPIEAPPAPPTAAPGPAAVPAPAPPLVPPSFSADYLNNPPPAYPAVSRRMREEGRVVLRVFVSEHGVPAQVQMRTSSGHARLDDAAMETVKQWKFVPARRGDTPVGAWVLVPISFNLRS